MSFHEGWGRLSKWNMIQKSRILKQRLIAPKHKYWIRNKSYTTKNSGTNRHQNTFHKTNYVCGLGYRGKVCSYQQHYQAKECDHVGVALVHHIIAQCSFRTRMWKIHKKENTEVSEELKQLNCHKYFYLMYTNKITIQKR